MNIRIKSNKYYPEEFSGSLDLLPDCNVYIETVSAGSIPHALSLDFDPEEVTILLTSRPNVLLNFGLLVVTSIVQPGDIIYTPIFNMSTEPFRIAKGKAVSCLVAIPTQYQVPNINVDLGKAFDLQSKAYTLMTGKKPKHIIKSKP